MVLKFSEIKICKQYRYICIYIYISRQRRQQENISQILQGGPLPVTNRVVTPLKGVVGPVTHL